MLRSDLVKNETLVAALNKKKAECEPLTPEAAFGYLRAFKDVFEVLIELPGVDVEAVVRCRDCKHAARMYFDGRTVWSCRWSAYLRNGDHYCKLGERRTEEWGTRLWHIFEKPEKHMKSHT